MKTKRGQLVQQMKQAIYELTKPKHTQVDAIEFDVADTTFNFTMEDLNEEVKD